MLSFGDMDDQHPLTQAVIRCRGLSALLTTVMPAMRTTVRTIRDAGLPVKILVGGAPITHEFATDIGADGYARDAGSAVDAAMELLRGDA